MAKLVTLDDEIISIKNNNIKTNNMNEDSSFVKIRFVSFGTYGRKHHHIPGHSYPEAFNNMNTIFLAFHDDEKLGTKIYSFEGCKNYINGFKGRIELGDSDFTKKQLSEIYSLVNLHNETYKK